MICAGILTYGDPDVVHAVRPRHRAYVHGLLESGRALSGGTLQPEFGGLFLYVVDSVDEARELARNDPFVTEGAVVRWEVHEYETHGVRPELLVVTG
ncbi:hypothetical protein GCM10027515_03860 [Schumannella luteola]|uniref:YCII-related domain-containing protein n=1 Tax=Schumannella luteola TaxID=472059 RepID=A0A852YL61_9MICO|nr:YciI family protein [Schumannella luteola]NYG98479.1 hypothetical protein [Schumannella luteola]TPX01295.1 hypothetical protein FJ656_28300 [Schumannella luteola]